MGDSRLYNCQPDGEAPDWKQFAYLELAGCIDARADEEGDETEIVGNIPADHSEFFTVYARDKEGLAEAITDIVDPREALAVAAELVWRSKLQCIIAPTLMPEKIRHDR